MWCGNWLAGSYAEPISALCGSLACVCVCVCERERVCECISVLHKRVREN